MEKYLRHGDVPIRRIETTSLQKLPDGLKPIGQTLAYGEVTGHHHSMRGSAQVLQLEKPIELEIAGEQMQVQKFLHVDQDAILEHQEHKTIQVPKGDYIILEERQYNPFDEEIRKVMD